jgi:alkylation response protein AidB-like acyl-CoA dehydrogenase
VTARPEAQPDAPPRMLVVALDPGTRADLSPWRAHGMRASATGTLDFTDLPVSPDDILGEPGDYERQPAFSAGAWRFLAVQAGGIAAVVEAWRTHLRATGRGEDPHQLARLGQGAIALETAALWVARAARTASEAADPEGAVAYVNLARLAVERAGLDVIEGAQRSVGLQGFLRDHPLERLCRDLATYLRQPAPDRALAAGARHVLAAPGGVADLWT